MDSVLMLTTVKIVGARIEKVDKNKILYKWSEFNNSSE
jgi:hypothetical protein